MNVLNLGAVTFTVTTVCFCVVMKISTSKVGEPVLLKIRLSINPMINSVPRLSGLDPVCQRERVDMNILFLYWHVRIHLDLIFY